MAQSGFTIGASANVLLDYAVQTAPEPLQVSPGTGEIDFVVSNGTGDTITCNEIQIAVPIGTLAQELTDNPGSIQLAATPSDQWAFDPPDKNDPGTFVARPTKPQYAQFTVDTTLFLQIYAIEVNAEIGTFELDLTEMSSTGNTPSPHTASWKLPKFPYGFTLSNFVPSSPQVDDGQPVTLTWTASDNAAATMRILYDQYTPVDVTTVRTWTTPQGLHNDTTFILDAELQYDTGTVHTYLTATVTVADPDITASSLNVLGTSQLDGNATVGTSSAPAALAVNGALTTSANAAIGGALSAATGTVGGALNVSGLLSALGPIAFSAVGSPQSVGMGTFGPAATDGFVVGVCSAAGIDPGARCMGWLYGSCNGIVVRATGGNLSGPGYNTNSSASFMLPVPRGAYWSLTFNSAGLPANPWTACWWVPLGTAPGGAEVPARIGDSEVESLRIARLETAAAPAGRHAVR